MDDFTRRPGDKGYFCALSTSDLNELTSHGRGSNSFTLRRLFDDRLAARRAAADMGDAMHEVIFVVNGAEYRAQLVKAHKKTVRRGKGRKTEERNVSVQSYVRLVRASTRRGR